MSFSMKYPTPPQSHGAFSLIELLVAFAVLAVLGALVIGISEVAGKITSQSNQRMDVDAQARQALDRLSADISRMVIRRDLPVRLEKRNGNDALVFVSDAQGYTSGRGISKVGYRIENNSLLRGVESTAWEAEAGGPQPLEFLPLASAAAKNDHLSINAENFDVVADNVFRLEIAFLMQDGSIRETLTGTGLGIPGANGEFVASNLARTEGAPENSTVRAIIVGIALLDEKNLLLLEESQRNLLASYFPDASPGDADFSSLWANSMISAQVDLPPQIAGGIRHYQRYIFLEN